MIAVRRPARLRFREGLEEKFGERVVPLTARTFATKVISEMRCKLSYRVFEIGSSATSWPQSCLMTHEYIMTKSCFLEAGMHGKNGMRRKNEI